MVDDPPALDVLLDNQRDVPGRDVTIPAKGAESVTTLGAQNRKNDGNDAVSINATPTCGRLSKGCLKV